MDKRFESVRGYPRLAHRFADRAVTASFRGFLELGNLTLLHMQAKLVDLENKLGEQIVADSRSSDKDRRLFAADWACLNRVALGKHVSASEEPGSSPGERKKQAQLLEEAKGSLREYYDFFLLLRRITAVAAPRKSDLGHHQWWLQQPGKGQDSLLGDDNNVWGSLKKPDSCAGDLKCMKPRRDDDLFTEWMKSKFIFWFDNYVVKHFTKSPSNDDEFGYKEATIHTCASIFVMALVSLLLISSIGILYWVRSMTIRLVLIAIFCVLFIVCMTCVTQAKRSEIFSAVSAFAAVELVFVANNVSSTNGNDIGRSPD